MDAISLLDGSIGQELVKRSGDKATPLWSTQVLIDHPELVEEVHRAYFEAGATIATTNTYAVLRDRLEPVGLAHETERLWERALDAARKARDTHGSGRLAGAIGPLVGSYRPDACPPAPQVAEAYAEKVAHIAPNVDFLLIETVTSLDHAEGGLAAAQKAGKPVWLSLSVDDEDGARLRSGELLSAVGPLLEKYPAEAVLLNCSRPEAITTGLDHIAAFGKPYGGYANGFTQISDAFLKDRPTVDVLEQRRDLDPEAYARFVMGWVEHGARIVGGCCEVGPAHIAELSRQLHAAGYAVV